MNTKEDYEFAAKAAGIEFGLVDGQSAIIYADELKTTWDYWNPLTDGNDSQDLMVRLELEVDCWCGYVDARRGKIYYRERFTPGDVQSMREAIFRVAVGRAMT